MSSSEALTLSNLPRDVIRDIVRIILASNVEDLDAARLISPRWNGIIDNNRTLFPSIQLFRWIDAVARDREPKLFMRISSNHRKYLKVVKWLFCPVAGNAVEVDSGERFLMRQYVLGKIFKRCSHIEIVQLSAEWVNKKEEHEVLRNYCEKLLELVGGATVKRLVLDTLLFDYDFEDHLFHWYDFKSRGEKPYFGVSCAVIRRLLAKIPGVELVSHQHLRTPDIGFGNAPDQKQIDDNRRSNCQQFIERLHNESPSTDATMIEEPNGPYGGITLRVDLKTMGF